MPSCWPPSETSSPRCETPPRTRRRPPSRRARSPVLPFERLRALARYSSDDDTLVLEAADCLAEFGPDPTQLVTVCRRLVAHHPSCGPLWWLCARIVSTPDPEMAARAAARTLEADRSADRLAALLP